MTKKTPDGRRKLLKSIAVGSGAIVAGKSLPESWSKPVVDTVMLPAHAATTDDTGSAPTPLPTSYNDDFVFSRPMNGQNSPLENILSGLVQDAHAQAEAGAREGSMCVDTSKAPAFEATVLLSDSKSVLALYTGTGTIGSSAATLVFQEGCDWFGSVKIEIASNDANGALYTVTAHDGDQTTGGTAPVGTDCPVSPGECQK